MSKFQAVTYQAARRLDQVVAALLKMAAGWSEYQLKEHSRDVYKQGMYVQWRSGREWYIVGLLLLSGNGDTRMELRSFLEDEPPDHVAALAAFRQRLERSFPDMKAGG